MSDDFNNLFDDDSLVPDWLQDEMGASASDESAAGSSNVSQPSWEQLRGEAPPPQTAETGAASPWETLEGPEAPAPQAATAPAPWDILSDDSAAPPPAQPALDAGTIDWTAAADEPATTGASEVPRGLTGELPWMSTGEQPAAGVDAELSWDPDNALADDTWDTPADETWATSDTTQSDWDTPGSAQPDDGLAFLGFEDEAAAPEADEFDFADSQDDAPPQPSLAEKAGLTRERFTLDGLIDEFQDEPPAEPQPEPEPPSLAARLRSLSPTPVEPEPPAEDVELREDEAGWMSAFGQAAEDAGTVPAGDEDDMAWLAAAEAAAPEPVPVTEPDSPEEDDPFAFLDGDESEDDDEDSFDFEFDDDELPALRGTGALTPPEEAEPAGELPEWLATTYEDDDEAHQAVDEAAETDEAEDLPEWVMQDTDQPDSGGIRRIAPPSTEGQTGGTGGIRRLSEAKEPELTFDEWEQAEIARQQEAERTPEDRLMDEVPTWFKDQAGDAPLPPEFQQQAPPPKQNEGPEFVPGWFMGLEEQDPEEAPDWFKSADLSADALSAPLALSESKTPEEDEPTELPDWFTGEVNADWTLPIDAPPSPIRRLSADQPPEEPPPPPVTTAAPEPEEEPDLDALFDTVDDELPAPDLEPGAVPDWLRDSIPDDADMPQPDLAAMFDEVDEATIPPQQQVMAEPEDIPFPDLDLDQTMPVEQSAFEVEPSSEGDFVERFDPITPDAPEPSRSPTPAPLSEDAPNWLREMANEGEGVLPVESMPDLDMGAMPDIGDGLDWLADIGPDDMGIDEVDFDMEPASAEEALPEIPDFPMPASDMPTPEPGLLAAEGLDSNALDDLLGLGDNDAALIPFQEEEQAEITFEDGLLDFEAGEESVQLGGDEAAEADNAFAEIFGTPDPEPEAEEGFSAPHVAVNIPDPAAAKAPQKRRGLFRRRKEDDKKPPKPAPTTLFDEEPEPEPEPAQAPTEPQPEWIAELRPDEVPVPVRAGGVEINLKQRKLADLPERLRDLHQIAQRELKPAEPEELAEHSALAGVNNPLPLADFITATEGTSAISDRLVVEDLQQRRAERLRTLLEQTTEDDEEDEVPPGFDYGETFEYDRGENAEAAATPRRKRRVRSKPDRLLVMVVMLAALVIPFASDAFHFAADPPPLDDERESVSLAVANVEAGAYVLFAFEYGPTAAGELDLLAEAVLRDVLQQNAIPLTTSTDPLGALHAQAVMEKLADDDALLAARGQGETSLDAGTDYVLLSYLPGEAVGVRTLATTKADTAGNLKDHPAFSAGLHGETLDLSIGGLDRDIALLVVIGEESNDVRIWNEQLEELTLPRVALVAAGIEPLTVPYVHEAGYVGYLSGVRDAYAYNAARNTGARTPYEMPQDFEDLPEPETARWHSMALGAALAAGLIALGMVVNLFRALVRRRRR